MDKKPFVQCFLGGSEDERKKIMEEFLASIPDTEDENDEDRGK